MEQKIKEWYALNHPEETYTQYLNGKITFGKLWEGMKKRKDFYRMVGFADSLIRENIFQELANRLNITYKEVQTLWLES